MPRLATGAVVVALVATACTVQPIEDPGIGAGGLTSTVHAVDGTAIAQWHAASDRVAVAYDDLPQHLIDAVVAIEDHRFWIHNGVDPRAVVRAARANLDAGEIVQGGSTITQQYVKNVLLSDELTLDRKLTEAGLALQVEETLSKEEILERYLNSIPFGRNAVGIGAAARRYFGVDVADLTLAESALLAGIIKAPSAYDPAVDLVAAWNRRATVLERMAELGVISAADVRSAIAEPISVVPADELDIDMAPYFVAAVRRSLLQLPELGTSPAERAALLDGGGLRIFTTLDLDVQRAAEASVASVVPGDGPGAAVAAVDPQSGHVLALVGGRDYYDPKDPVAQFDLSTQGRRQAGSAFKPFVLAAALEAGLSPDDVFPGGGEVTIETPIGSWFVANHEGAVYPALSLFEATVFSVNVVYARLIELVGAAPVAELAAAAGIATPLQAIPSLALGTQEVSVLDMASAYGTFAAGGIHVDPILVTRIEDAAGTLLYEAQPRQQRAMTPSTAETVTAVLTDVVRRGTGQHARIGRPVAGKTGTTEAHYDAWFVGYTPELAAAVWIGFPEGDRPLESPHTPYTITGGTWPAQIFARFAAAALSGTPYAPDPPTRDADLVAVDIDLHTGFLAGPLCPRSHVATVYVSPEAAPTVPCPVHASPAVHALDDGVFPDVAGLPLTDAVLLLEAAGSTITVGWTPPGAAVPGTVLDQEPSPGTAVADGDRVTLTVAGPEPGTSTPDVLGLDEPAARERLAAVGVPATVLHVPESDPDDAARRSGLVWGQQPSAGAPLDDRVVLWVNP
jgi:penicillin-binding protein 1A